MFPLTTLAQLSLLLLVLATLVVVSLALLLLKARKQQEQHFALIDELEFEKRLLMKGQDTVLLVVNQEGTITLANNVASKFFLQKEVIGKRFNTVVENNELNTIITEALEKHSAVKKTFHLNTKSDHYQAGEDRVLNVRAKMIDEGERGKFVRIYIQDQTEQARGDQIKKDFIANASHEIRTPLAIITGYIETLMDESVIEDKETSLRFLGVMKKHGSRLTQLIEEMLIISKLESSVPNALKFKPFRMKDCINECILLLDPILKERGAVVHVILEEPNITIEADRFYWNQIIFNLVENAIKQNPEQPLEITVTCSHKHNSNKIELTVRDNGVGIPSEDLPYIFGRFYRVEKHHSQNTIKGTGLGLSIVKHAVEAHQGTITCDSIQHQETCFTITLPSTIRAPDLTALS